MHSPSFMVCFHKVFSLAIAALFIGSSTGAHAEEKKPAAKKPVKITYDEHIKPIFRAKCFTCHNPNKKSGDLDLTNYTNLMQGGGSGEVIEGGSTEDSYLYSLVTHESEPFMPPKSDKLPKELLDLIAGWINGGALENSGSKPLVSRKPKFDLSLKSAPTGKPPTPPLPGRLSLEPVVNTKQKTAVTALATSPWAPVVAVAGQKQVLLYHSQSLEPLGILPFPEGFPQVLKFSRNGSLLLAGGGRGASRGKTVVWDIKTGRRVLDVGDELDSVLAADISSDHSLIALGGPNKVVRIYSTADGKLLHEISKHTGWITSIEFSPDGVLLATGDRNGGVFVWEANTAREYLSLRAHSKMITGLSWRIDSNILASCSEDASIRLWEMENGRQVKSWGAHGGGTASMEFTRDGRLVSCGRDRVTKLWDQNGKQLRAFTAFADLALRVTHCDETNRVIAGDWTGAIRVWNAADGKQLGELDSNPQKLSTRLDAATKLLSAKQAEHQKKLAAAYQTVQAAAVKVKADLAAAQKTAADTQKNLQTAQNRVKQTKQSITQLTAQQQAAAKTVAALQPLLAPLKDSVAKAQVAVSKATGDKELAAVVAQLKAQFDKKTATHAAAVKTAGEKKTALEKSKIQLAASEKQVRDFTAGLTAAQKKVAAITPTVKPAVDKAAAAKKTADVAAAALAAAQQSTNRWKNEIALLDCLVCLTLFCAVCKFFCVSAAVFWAAARSAFTLTAAA